MLRWIKELLDRRRKWKEWPGTEFEDYMDRPIHLRYMDPDKAWDIVSKARAIVDFIAGAVPAEKVQFAGHTLLLETAAFDADPTLHNAGRLAKCLRHVADCAGFAAEQQLAQDASGLAATIEEEVARRTK